MKDILAAATIAVIICLVALGIGSLYGDGEAEEHTEGLLIGYLLFQSAYQSVKRS